MSYSWNKDMSIDDQWQSWQDNTDLSKIPDIDTDTLKETIIKDLTFVSAMTVQEYTLYQKFQEVKFRYPTVETNSFFDDKPAMLRPEQATVIQEVKNNFWLPEDPEEYLNLQPELIWTDGAEIQSHTNAKGSEIWNALRTFLSTMKNNSNIGRNLNFLIRLK